MWNICSTIPKPNIPLCEVTLQEVSGSPAPFAPNTYNPVLPCWKTSYSIIVRCFFSCIVIQAVVLEDITYSSHTQQNLCKSHWRWEWNYHWLWRITLVLHLWMSLNVPWPRITANLTLLSKSHWEVNFPWRSQREGKPPGSQRSQPLSSSAPPQADPRGPHSWLRASILHKKIGKGRWEVRSDISIQTCNDNIFIKKGN